MRWLLHGNLTPAVAQAMTRHEQAVQTPVDIGLSAESSPQQILETARVKQLEILTSDPAFVDAATASSHRFNRLIVFLQLAGQDVEQDDAIDRLFTRYKRLSPGRLYTVTENRVKIRQLKGSH